MNVSSDYDEKTSMGTTQSMQICALVCHILQIHIFRFLRKYLSHKSTSITEAPQHFTEEKQYC